MQASVQLIVKNFRRLTTRSSSISLRALQLRSTNAMNRQGSTNLCAVQRMTTIRVWTLQIEVFRPTSILANQTRASPESHRPSSLYPTLSLVIKKMLIVAHLARVADDSHELYPRRMITMRRCKCLSSQSAVNNGIMAWIKCAVVPTKRSSRLLTIIASWLGEQRFKTVSKTYDHLITNSKLSFFFI